MEIDTKGEILTHNNYDKSHIIFLVFFLFLFFLYSLSERIETSTSIIAFIVILAFSLLTYYTPRRISTFNKRSKKIEIVKSYARKTIVTTLSFKDVKKVELLDNSFWLSQGTKQVVIHLNDGKEHVIADWTSGVRGISVDTYRLELANKLSEFLDVPLEVVKGSRLIKE